MSDNTVDLILIQVLLRTKVSNKFLINNLFESGLEQIHESERKGILKQARKKRQQHNVDE